MLGAAYSVGILIGLWLVVSALANWEWFNAMPESPAAAAVFGEQAPRWLCGIIGLVFIGACIAGVVGLK